MMPALGLIAIGSRGRRAVPIPIPLILVWPLVGLGFVVVGLARLVRRKPGPRLAGATTALLAFCQLRGLRVDVHSSDDTRVFIRFM